MNTTMLPKEITSTLSATDMGDYYHCSYQYKGAKQWRRVPKDLNARKTRKLMIIS